MMITKHLVRAAKFTVLLAVAVVIGVGVTVGSALIGHEILVLIYGEDLSVIDDTLLMHATVALDYLVGIVVGLFVLVGGWRRFVRGPRAVAGSQQARE